MADNNSEIFCGRLTIGPEKKMTRRKKIGQQRPGKGSFRSTYGKKKVEIANQRNAIGPRRQELRRLLEKAELCK